jgi:genome maintenance exonuclease 1|tara:strand:+ start:1272 stop:1955 length:684 start_codon:yes stop_codon:yes gene_type:complete
MKKFNHVGPAKEIVELDSRTTPKGRFYKAPNGNWYPSVTTVTGHKAIEGIKKWEQRVGWTKAESIRRSSSWRGTKFHGIVEEYFKGNLEKVKESKGLPSYLFGFARETLDRIDNIHCLEAPLYSDDLCLAGRVDCIAEFDGELAIIDFKTTGTLKKEDWLHKYFVQEAAYAYMYYERTGVEVKKLVTLSVAEDGQTQVVQKYDKIPYVDTLCQWIKDYRYFQESIAA